MTTGVGYTIDGADISISGGRFFSGHYTSMEAEHLALVEALRVATVNSSERKTCNIYTDAQPLVSKMLYDERDRGDWQDRRESYEWLASKWDECNLQFVGRESNEEAHDLAREALFEGRDGRKS